MARDGSDVERHEDCQFCPPEEPACQPSVDRAYYPVGDAERRQKELQGEPKLNAHARAMTDLSDEYTQAITDGSLLEFFSRLATERLELERLREAHQIRIARERDFAPTP